MLINTRYNYLVPYNDTGIDYLVSTGHRSGQNRPVSLWVLSCSAFVAIAILGYLLYSRRQDKG